jgi:serine protease Do
VGEAKVAEAKGPDLALLRQSIVIVEQAKRPIATGVILGGDGRILTALTPIGMGNSLTVRYANGEVKRLRVAASHRGMNLALLSPEETRSTQGLRASRLSADDPAAQVRWLRSGNAGPGNLAPVGPLRREALTGGDDFALRDVFTVGTVPRPTEIGSALVDTNGDVVGLLSQACQTQPNGDCRTVSYVVPVAMIKEFLRAVPAGALSPAPWIGMRVTEAESCAVKALRIVSVDSRGPLATLGLRPGKDIGSADVLLAIDGIALGSSRAFDEILHRHKIGDRVRLLVLSDGRYREVTAVLGSEPERQATASAMLSQDVGY